MTSVNSTRIEELRKQLEERRKKRIEEQTIAKALKPVPEKYEVMASRYIEAWSRRSEADKVINKYKNDIKEFMTSQGQAYIFTDEGALAVEPHERPIVNSRFNTYDADEIESIIPLEYAPQVFKIVVDEVALEGLIQAGLIDSSVRQYRILETRDHLVVKKDLAPWDIL